MSSRRSVRISKRNQKERKSGASSLDSGPLDKYLIASGSCKRKQSWLAPPQQADESDPVQEESKKQRQQYHIQNQWQPIATCGQISLRTLVPSPVPPTQQLPCAQSMAAAGASHYTFKNIFTFPSNRCPLPALKWGHPQDVWDALKAKEQKYVRVGDNLAQHPHLEYKMRTVLLDWIIEVCDVYVLHRETFYLATDFIDRFLAFTSNLQKYQLQLIGVTALFIAAKIEEIYPPKISEFAYVTDGACSEQDITNQELIILKTLKWDLSPVTVNSWLTLYLNVLTREKDGAETNLTSINYSRRSYLKQARLMDLCTLDEGSLQFRYSILAAAILYHFGDELMVKEASGYGFEEIESCVAYLVPFVITTRELGEEVTIREREGVLEDDLHNIQTHEATIALLNKAKLRQCRMSSSVSRSSPPNVTENIPDILTPPPTKHKHSSNVGSVDANQSSQSQ